MLWGQEFMSKNIEIYVRNNSSSNSSSSSGAKLNYYITDEQKKLG